MSDLVAKESFDFWRPLVRLPVHAWAWLGNEGGETSFMNHAVGDHGEAFGPAQDHLARVIGMLKGTGIDVRTASHLDQLRAIHWEVTAGSYRHVWPKLMATDTLWSAISVLVHDFEQSGSQARDIARRVGLAEQLMASHAADWERTA